MADRARASGAAAPIIQDHKDRVTLAAGFLSGRFHDLFPGHGAGGVAAHFTIQMVRVDPEFVMGLFDQIEQGPIPLSPSFKDEAQRVVDLLKAIIAGDLDAATNDLMKVIGAEMDDLVRHIREGS